jgi:hypothetical protein
MNWEGGEGVHETRSSPKDCKAFDTTRNIGLLAPPSNSLSSPHLWDFKHSKKINGFLHSTTLFQFYRKTSLRSVDPKQPKMSNFHFDLSLKLSQGEEHHFSGEVQNDLRGGAHLPTPPLKNRPC